MHTFGPCCGRFPCELDFDAGDPRRLCEIQDEEAAKHAWRGICEDAAAASGGVACSEENDGLCKSYVKGILVGRRLRGCGHEWGDVWWGEGRRDGVKERRRRKQLRGQIETGAVPGLHFFAPDRNCGPDPLIPPFRAGCCAVCLRQPIGRQGMSLSLAPLLWQILLV